MFPDAEFVVRGDVPAVEVTANDMLSSVFRNLLNNAVQHNDKREPRVTVSVVVDEPDVVVTITDNGPEIPESHEESIFGDHHKGIASSGTGMGLYLTRTLVTNFGGEISVSGNDPTGSVFEIRLPKADSTPIRT